MRLTDVVLAGLLGPLGTGAGSPPVAPRASTAAAIEAGPLGSLTATSDHARAGPTTNAAHAGAPTATAPTSSADSEAGATGAYRSLPIQVPSLPRAQLAAGALWRLRVGTGASPELGVVTPPATLQAGQARTRLVLPWYVSASLRRFEEGRHFGHGIDVQLDLSGLLRLDQGDRAVDADLHLPALEAWSRAYLDDSVARPWYVELTAGAPGARQGTHAARGAATSRAYRLPLRTQLAVGRGRILPIGPRLRLAKLERLFRDEGVLDAPLSAEIGRQVLLAWWSLRTELGYARRLARTLELLETAGLLRGPVAQDTVYAFGRIFEDPALTERWEGVDAQLALRYGVTWQSGPANEMQLAACSTMVLRASHRRVVNLGHDAAWSYEVVLSFAPRRVDRGDNFLRPLARSTPAIDHGRVALVAPVGYRHFFYDPAYNLQKMLVLQARVGVGVDVAAPRQPRPARVNAMVGGGAEAFWFAGRVTGLTAAIDADIGYAYAHLAYVLGLRVGLAFGRDQATYVVP